MAAERIAAVTYSKQMEAKQIETSCICYKEEILGAIREIHKATPAPGELQEPREIYTVDLQPILEAIQQAIPLPPEPANVSIEIPQPLLDMLHNEMATCREEAAEILAGINRGTSARQKEYQLSLNTLSAEKEVLKDEHSDARKEIKEIKGCVEGILKEFKEVKGRNEGKYHGLPLLNTLNTMSRPQTANDITSEIREISEVDCLVSPTYIGTPSVFRPYTPNGQANQTRRASYAQSNATTAVPSEQSRLPPPVTRPKKSNAASEKRTSVSFDTGEKPWLEWVGKKRGGRKGKKKGRVECTTS
jgi:hypothetical protein